MIYEQITPKEGFLYAGQRSIINPQPNGRKRPFPVFYSVSQPEGKACVWVLAHSHEEAKTIYRAIPPKTRRGTPVYVYPLRRTYLAPGAEFWTKLGDEVACMYYGADDHSLEVDDSALPAS